MSAEIVFETRDLKKRFGGIRAVDGVSVRVKQGEIRAIIGPNGAGKSTFFNICCGELVPDGGGIWFRGEDLTGLPSHAIARRGIRRTMQITHIFPRLSVLDNVVIAVLAHGGQTLNLFTPARKLARERAEELLELVGLADQAHKVSGTMSYGDQKRLELAIALAGNPALLLLDEPMAGLPAADRVELTDMIHRVVEEKGLTVLLTEHDMGVVFSIAQAITVLHQGRIIAEGTPQEVRANDEVQRIYLGVRH